MSDRATTHVVGHTITKEGMILPFHFTLADNAGLMFSKFGMRDMEAPELERESDWWANKRMSDLLDGLRDAPAWIHPEYVPVDTAPQVDERRAHRLSAHTLPRAELEQNYRGSLPLGLPSTNVMLRMWDGAFDPHTTSRRTSP
jgi:hypothetical protein